jgi:hypothetical protein
MHVYTYVYVYIYYVMCVHVCMCVCVCVCARASVCLQTCHLCDFVLECVQRSCVLGGNSIGGYTALCAAGMP